MLESVFEGGVWVYTYVHGSVVWEGGGSRGLTLVCVLSVAVSMC